MRSYNNGHGEFGYRLQDLVNRKIIQCKDVVFFEDQTIEDLDQKKTQSFNEYRVDLGLVVPPSVTLRSHIGKMRRS